MSEPDVTQTLRSHTLCSSIGCDCDSLLCSPPLEVFCVFKQSIPTLQSYPCAPLPSLSHTDLIAPSRPSLPDSIQCQFAGVNPIRNRILMHFKWNVQCYCSVSVGNSDTVSHANIYLYSYIVLRFPLFLTPARVFPRIVACFGVCERSSAIS